MVTFSFALRKVRTAQLMPKEKTIWTGARERLHRKKIIGHLIDVVSGQDMIMPEVAQLQSNPALRIPA